MVTALKSSVVNQQFAPRQRNTSSASAASVNSGVLPPPQPRSRRRSSRRGARGATLSPTPVNEQVVKSLPKTQPFPAWLKLLVRTQRASLVMTFLLVATVLTTYSWTVVVQQRWGQQYHRFESLKKQERQLITGNEVLKNQMARQAESPSSGLMVPDPSNAIFLPPASPRPALDPKTHLSTEPAPTKPLGY